MAVSLQTRVLYGLKTDIANNAHYITDAEVLYPVGNAIAIHNILQRQQKLIRLPERYYDANGMCVSPNKKFVAISDIGDKPTISIYDITSLKRRKLLGIPFDAPGVTSFTCISFTFDSKNLVAITSEPDQTMLFYNWEKGKVESTFKLANPQNPLAIADVLSCNPTDATVVAVGGAYTFKFLIVSETVWRPYGFAKAENLLVCSMAWLDGDRLMVGTQDGRMLYLENGDLKNVYRMIDTVTMNLKIREEYVMPIVTGSQVTLGIGEDFVWQQNVRCLIAFPRGFAYAYGGGTIILFEKEGKHKYTKRNVYVIPQRMVKDDDPNLYKIHTINVNPSFDRLIVTTGWSQLYYATLWGPDLQMDPEPQKMEIMGQPLHHGPISGLSMCAWKPVFMTCGEFDHSVRLWDFETESLIMLKQYEEDIFSVALHPMGLFCLIGFTDKLRFMSILIDNLLPMHEIAIRNCKTVRFSHNGHLFAAVNVNVIQVYTTISFHNPFIFKGHTGKVKTLLWSQTDLKILSMGTEGSIYEWDMTTGTRSSEFFWKTFVLHDIALSSDASFIYLIAQDDHIREIKENEIVREFQLPGKEMQQIIMGKDDLTLFITSPSGIIISLKSPLQTPIESMDFHMHCVDITEIAISYNENYLISVAKDGSLCIWKLYFPEGKMKLSRDLPYTDEVLIGKSDLKEKIHSIQNLTVRLRELETEHAYRLRQIDVQHNDKLREVHQGYCEAIKELVDKIDTDREDHKNEMNNINISIVRMKASHEEAMQQMENNYEAKLITEYDKYQAFEERTNAMRENFEKQLKDLEKRDAEQLQTTVAKYEAMLYEKKTQLEETFDEMMHKERVHEHLMRQVEDDADREILEIRTKYENLLYEEKQISLKLKGEAGVMRNKFMASQRDVDDLKRQVNRVQGEYTQFHKHIQDLEKQIMDLKKEIIERDATIRNKEEQIYDMKRTNQELEKFKFVLNFKIDELRNQMQPKDQEIQELKNSIRNMQEELMSLQKTNEKLERQLYEEREKLKTARREKDREIHKNTRSQQQLRKIRVEIFEVSELVQEPNALKTAVINLYHKYSADDEILRSRKADIDAQCEFIKQKDQLEKIIASLKKQMFQEDTSIGDKELRLTEENSMLTVELNALRQELKQTRERNLYMENLLGLTKKDVRPAEARKILEQAFHEHQELQEKYMKQIHEYQQVISALKENIRQLLSKIPCEEKEEKTLS
ncbi:WD repeat-containing protein 65 [Trachymyrmex septentrionalis]|uniref:WD repeat-containing protein 65 n=1 Tax=Trachymyrmex septentrionalis TaxID=34720 RepID=A0A195FD87_9HYME|nr:PREDICTED: cilia- and flagella-associated protein 57 [Trachymyrmex septentrionalis]KYN38346.1 WD repeat-containing protein 65 [Trachymyrmex septentrionalis]